MRQLLILTLLTLLSCGGGERSQRRVPSIKSTIVERDNYSVKEFVGLSTPDESVNLAFKVPGQLISISVSKGVEVREGEVLAKLDARDFELQLMADRSSYEQAKSRAERTQRLLKYEAVSRAEAEVAESEFVRIKSMYDNAQDLLSETVLRSPFKALVEDIYVDTYQRVQAGERVIRVVSPTSTTVEFTIPESSIFAFLEPSTIFKVHFDAYQGATFDAKIKEYARTSSDASGFPAALTLTNLGDYTIQSGMSCTIKMMTPRADSTSVSVPISAIYAPVSGGNYLWVIGSEDRVSLRKVQLGALIGRDRVVVNSGVEAGSRVVSAGVYKLTDGEKVNVIEGL